MKWLSENNCLVCKHPGFFFVLEHLERNLIALLSPYQERLYCHHFLQDRFVFTYTRFFDDDEPMQEVEEVDQDEMDHGGDETGGAGDARSLSVSQTAIRRQGYIMSS